MAGFAEHLLRERSRDVMPHASAEVRVSEGHEADVDAPKRRYAPALVRRNSVVEARPCGDTDRAIVFGTFRVTSDFEQLPAALET